MSRDANAKTAVFVIRPMRLVTETVSGSSAIGQRPGFLKLLDKLERGDILVVTKLDRLGRNAMDVSGTVAKLEAAGVRVHCLALGGADLTSAAGKMFMHVVSAMAQFEKDLLIERTQEGLRRAKKDGKVAGRKSTLTEDQKVMVRKHIASGASVSELARRMKTSRMTIMRARDLVAPARSPR